MFSPVCAPPLSPPPLQDTKDKSTAAETGAESSVVMFERNSNFPLVRRVTLKKSGKFTIKAHYDAPTADSCIPSDAPLELATFTIDAPESATPNKIRVNVKQDVSGIITLSSAQSMEEIEEEAKAEEAKAEETKEGEETKAAEGEAPAEPVVAKKKYKKTNLTFTVDTTMTYSKDELNKVVEIEARMANADRVASETADMRNKLESYLYSMRDRIIGELKDYSTETEQVRATERHSNRATGERLLFTPLPPLFTPPPPLALTNTCVQTEFSAALEKMEDWLYSDEGFDTTKSVYAEKLGEVEKHGNPLETRMAESTGRQAAISTLKGTIETYKSFVGSADAKYEHITDEERGACRTRVNDAEAWLYEQIEKQSDLAQNVTPVLTLAMLAEKQKELTFNISPVMHKPKPAPKKEEKKEEAKGEEETKGEEGKEGDETKPMEDGAEPPAPPAEEEAAPMDVE